MVVYRLPATGSQSQELPAGSALRLAGGMWHTTEWQATQDEEDRCYQDGVDLCAISNMATGFSLFGTGNLVKG